MSASVLPDPRAPLDWTMLARQVLAQAEPAGACLIWTGGVTPSGEPVLDTGAPERPRVLARDVVWCVQHGAERPDRQRVGSVCGHARCVRPTHLELYRPIQPLRPRARLTEDEVRTIRELRTPMPGVIMPTIAELAKEYHVSSGTLRAIVAGRTWTELL